MWEKGYGKVRIVTQAFGIVSIPVGKKQKQAGVVPLTIIGNHDGIVSLCLFTDMAIASRALAFWPQKGKIVQLTSLTAIIDWVNQFAGPLGIERVTFDFEPHVSKAFPNATIEDVIAGCREGMSEGESSKS